MNWGEGTATWGTVKNSKVETVTRNKNGLIAVYRTPHLLVTVVRSLTGDVYKECYAFESATGKDVFLTVTASEFIQHLMTAMWQQIFV